MNEFCSPLHFFRFASSLNYCAVQVIFFMCFLWLNFHAVETDKITKKGAFCSGWTMNVSNSNNSVCFVCKYWNIYVNAKYSNTDSRWVLCAVQNFNTAFKVDNTPPFQSKMVHASILNGFHLHLFWLMNSQFDSFNWKAFGFSFKYMR